jgi:hypothetical protein
MGNFMKGADVVDLHVYFALDGCEFMSENVTERLATNLAKTCLSENCFYLSRCLQQTWQRYVYLKIVFI